MIKHVTNRPRRRWIAASGVLVAVAAATLMGISTSLASSGAACPPGLGPYQMSSAQQAACGVKAYPLVSATTVTSGPTAGATVYLYDIAGATETYTIPPASFDPATASPAELEAYGVPAAPPQNDPAAYGLWEAMVDNFKFVTPPPVMYVVPVSSAGVVAKESAKPSACPTGGRLPVNSWTATKSRLLPGGALELRVCRYDAKPHAGLTLRGSDLLTSSSQIAKDTRVLDGLPQAHGVINCPLDNGSELVLIGAYKSGELASVSLGLSGCHDATNGHLSRLALADPDGLALAKELTGLTS